MAIKKKKSPAKVARKKTVAKAKTKAKAAVKSRKAKPSSSTKKVVKKAGVNKRATRKVAATKKASASKKVVAKKAVSKKAVVKQKERAKVVKKKIAAVPKAVEWAEPKVKAKPEMKSEPLKVQPEKVKIETVKKAAVPKAAPVESKPLPLIAQMNMFQMPNQRPIAHKPAKTTTEETRTRYSEEELREFEKLILGKLEKAREEYKILKDTLNRTNDEGTDATSGGNTKVLEDGAETAEKENLSQLAARQQKYITNLENALVRIKNGTYGICSVTGKLISKERLIAVPHTTQSIEAKMMKQD